MDSGAEGKHAHGRTYGGNTDDHKLQKSWKKGLDEKLHRLHSLQFGVEHAMQKGDVETAITISICVIGFLESECQSDEGQRAFIAPIMDHARQRIDAVREESASVIDRRAFEQANCDKAQVFKKISSVDLDKIKQSKYFAPFFGSGAKAKQSAAIDCGTSSPKVAHRPGGQQRGIKEQETSMFGTSHMSKVESSREGISKACKYLTQAKLTTLYGGAKCSDAASTRPAVKGAEDQKTNEGHIIAKGLRSSYDKNHTVLPVFVISDEEKEQQKFPQKIKKPFQSEDCYIDCAEVRQSVAKRRKGFHSEEVDGASQREELKNDMDGSEQDDRTAGFVTAKQKWAMDSVQKRNSTSTFSQPSSLSISTNPATLYHARGTGPKTLGMSRRGVRGQFIPPVRPSGGGGGGYAIAARNPSGPDNGLDESTRRCMELLVGADGELPDKLKNVEPRLIEHISNEIMDQDPNVRWDDIGT